MARLLVIDDEKAILDLVKNSLEKDGHIVTVCESAADVTINLNYSRNNSINC